MFGKGHIVIAICICLLSGCSARGLNASREVVRQADSLRAEGLMYSDSTYLSQAYSTLHAWRHIYPTDYSHACYHYGRLLREKDNPVDAMQVFINATHSLTRDFHILGRVYSNMGSICHLANDFSLSYNMYEKSANMFLKNGDTTLYYFGLNNIAYELAEQERKEETLALLSRIKKECPDDNVLIKTLETKARLYLKIKQYDSIGGIIDRLLRNQDWTAGYVLKAQALWGLGRRDSALYYAKQIMALPHITEQEKYNAMYILFNGDTTLQPKEIIDLSEQRADISAQKLIPLHKQFAIANNLLHYELEKKPVYIFAIPISIIALIFICTFTFYYKKIHKEKYKQQEILLQVQQEQTSRVQYRLQEIERVCAAIRSRKNWQQEINWKEYDLLCKYIDHHLFFFAHSLKEKRILHEREIRLCILVLIGGFSDKQMAEILCYGDKSIRGIKRYTAKKLGTNSANLKAFLLDLLTQ